MITRKEIRSRIIQILAPIAATKYDFPYRDIEKSSLPAIKVYTPSESVVETFDNDPFFRIKYQLQVVIECVVSAAGEVAVQSDDLSSAVLLLLAGDDSLGGLLLTPGIRLESTETSIEADGEVPVTKASMQFSCQYWQEFNREGDEEFLPTEVWLGMAPKIGIGHEDDYWQIAP